MTSDAFRLSNLLLWAMCGFVFWFVAHTLAVFLSGPAWLPFGPSVVCGTVGGSILYWVSLRDVGTTLSLVAIVLGIVCGAFIGWHWAMGPQMGPGSTLPGHRMPPNSAQRALSAAVIAGMALLSTWGVALTVPRFTVQRQRLVIVLVALAIGCIVLPAIAFS